MIGSAGRPLATLGAAGLLALIHATAAQAASKVWVSNAGADSGTCGAVTSPCRTFQQAHDNVPAGGDIGVLTPGDYGSVTITKSVNITNDGTGEASILLPSVGNGIYGIRIAAGTGDVVSLRGLILDGLNNSINGIIIDRASAVHIQNCVIRNFAAQGIQVDPENNLQLFVSDTHLSNSGHLPVNGAIDIFLTQGSGSASVVLDRVRLEDNAVAIRASDERGNANGIHVKLRDSIVSGSAGDGIYTTRPAGGGGVAVVVFVERSALVNNAGAGILADGPSAVLLSDSTVEYNGTGASSTFGGRLFTYGNNLIDNNAGEDLSPAAIARATK